MTVIVALVMFGQGLGSLIKEGLKDDIGTLTWSIAIESVVFGLIFDFVLPLITTLVAMKYWNSLENRSKFIISKLLYNHDQVRGHLYIT